MNQRGKAAPKKDGKKGDVEMEKKQYTLYETVEGHKLIIHKGCGFHEYFPRQSFYRAAVDLTMIIYTQDELYYYGVTELGEKIKIRK